MLSKTAWVGRDNTLKLGVLESNELQDLTAWTRAVLTIEPSGGGGATVLDTAVDTTVSALSATGVEVRPGRTGLTAGQYNVKIDLYDTDNPAGFRIPTVLTLTMEAP